MKAEDTKLIKNTIESQLCPKCREQGSLKYKRYLMFSRVCKNDGTHVKLPTSN